jgi:hypothetical protein
MIGWQGLLNEDWMAKEAALAKKPPAYLAGEGKKGRQRVDSRGNPCFWSQKAAAAAFLEERNAAKERGGKNCAGKEKVKKRRCCLWHISREQH